MKKLVSATAASTLAFGFLACQSAPPTPPPAAPPPAPAIAPVVAAAPSEMSIPPGVDPGFDPTIIDRTVNPCDDFYRYACGGWIVKTEIPPDRPSWGRSFSEINERNQQKLHEILDAFANGVRDPKDDESRKVGDFYAACMDETKAETASWQTLATELKRIDTVRDAKTLARRVADLQLAGVNAFFDFDSGQDFKDATQVIGQADQGGLGLPDRDYYLKDDAKSVEIRKLYRDHVAKMLELGGARTTDAGKQADTILALETALAKVSLDRVDRRDPKKVYHRIERAGLVKAAPSFAWKTYFETLGTPTIDAINVASPEFFTGMSAVLTRTPMADLRTYLRWQTLNASASALGKKFVDEDFRFTAAALTGAQQILPRWKRCANATDGALGESLAQEFVRQTFGAEGKARSQAMIAGIEAAFEANLATLAWMDADTRGQASEKAKKVFNKIGYPDKWRDYGALAIDRKSHLGNVMRANVFESKRQLAKIGKPVDRAEWGMTPPTVNAYYNPLLNEMVFPAGILQPPFFNRAAGDVTNYGGIGMVMGHELTHGFDDQGKQFDAVGNMRDWWTPASGQGYTERAECVVKQYSGFKALPDVNVNGKLTLGENIADLGGMKLALAAARASRAGKSPAKLAGLDDDQQFFVAFAQTWCSKRREPYTRMLAAVDSHSPPEFRVNGPVSNNPDFATAFQCPAGAPMNPPQKCQVW